MCESFVATLESELLDRRKFATKADARMAVFEFLDGWCNSGRLPLADLPGKEDPRSNTNKSP